MITGNIIYNLNKKVRLLAAACALWATVPVAAGVYTNPIINADYSDPDVIAAADGSGYYMTASSFASTPGLPILFSEDLVNWEIVNHALERLVPTEFYNSEARHGKGVWAPAMRFHKGLYYIYWGDPDFGIYAVTSPDPKSKWSEPVLVVEGKGLIDPCPLFDEDGRVWLANGWAGSRAKFNSVLTVRELSADGMKAISSPVMVYDGNPDGNHTVEGPKFYKRNGQYYIFAPAGGVVSGWQLALKSNSPTGPYEVRTVMAEGNSGINGPHQGAWVETPQGEHWFINFQDKGVPGRVIHLNPMAWKGEWPVIGKDIDGDGCGEPVKEYALPAGCKSQKKAKTLTDTFNSIKLPAPWQWSGNVDETDGFTTPSGYVRLYGHQLSDPDANLWEAPNLLLRKFPGDEFTATATLSFSSKATGDGVRGGLIVMGHDYACLAVEKLGDKFILKLVQCLGAEAKGKETAEDVVTLDPTRAYEAGAVGNLQIDLTLRVSVGKDYTCSFAYSIDGKRFHDIKTTKPFKAREGKWIGAKVGVFACGPADTDKCWLDLDEFTISDIK